MNKIESIYKTIKIVFLEKDNPYILANSYFKQFCLPKKTFSSFFFPKVIFEKKHQKCNSSLIDLFAGR